MIQGRKSCEVNHSVNLLYPVNSVEIWERLVCEEVKIRASYFEVHGLSVLIWHV